MKNVREAVPANFVFTAKDKLTGTQRRVDCLRKSWITMLEKAGVGEIGFDQFVLHDFRRYRNVISECIYNMSPSQRSMQLGNSERINSTHYSGEVGAELMQVQGQMRSLVSTNLYLEAELKQLKEENALLKSDAEEISQDY